MLLKGFPDGKALSFRLSTDYYTMKYQRCA